MKQKCVTHIREPPTCMLQALFFLGEDWSSVLRWAASDAFLTTSSTTFAANWRTLWSKSSSSCKIQISSICTLIKVKYSIICIIIKNVRYSPEKKERTKKEMTFVWTTFTSISFLINNLYFERIFMFWVVFWK